MFAGLFAQGNQGSITGVVFDEEGSPLSGATVKVKETNKGTATNSSGYFIITGLDYGTYSLEVEFLGYQSQEKEVVLNNNLTRVNFTLKGGSILTGNVVVKATRANSKTPVAFSDIKKEELNKINVNQDIPYLLEMTPSVVATSESGTGMGYTGIRVRGTDATRINVTVNGIPLNDSESHGVFWVNMPDFTSSVNDVQIQRGVGTSTNGAGAFGATINFQTLAVNEKPYASLNSTFGSFNTFKRSVEAGTGLMDNKFAFDVRYSKLNSDGFIKRGFSDHQSTFLSGGYYGDKTMVKANVIMGQEHTGITWWGVPDYMIDTDPSFNPAGEYTDDAGQTQYYDNQTDNYWQNHYQLMFAHSVNKNLNLNLNLHATTGKGYYEQYKAEDDFADYGLGNIYLADSVFTMGTQEYYFSDSVISSSDIIRQKWLDNLFYGLTASAVYTVDKLDAIIGGGWNQYNGDHFGLVKWMKFNGGTPLDHEWYRNNGFKTDWNVYARANYEVIDDLNIYGDIQYRNIHYKMEGPDDDLVALDQEHTYSFINPKFGALYDIDENSNVYASFAVANREPSRADLKDASKSGGTDFPVHETLFDYEFGYNYKSDIANAGANAYFMDYKNQLVLTGELNSVGYPVMTNVDNSYRAGIEMFGSVSVSEILKLGGNLTLSQNKIIDYIEYAARYDADWNETYTGVNLGTTNISYSPNVVGSAVLTFIPLKDLDLSIISKFVGKQYFTNASSENSKIDPYSVFNFRAGYSFSVSNIKRINVQLSVNNLLNKNYISNAYGGNWFEQGVEKTWSYYFPQAGTHFMLRLGLDF